MAVACSVNGLGQFNKVSRTKPCTPRRRKDYSKPLHVDCSVEYELPNSAKPPVGNKNEPLLMIHPSYYRREESRHRSQFINNLPRRRISSRYCRSTTNRSNNLISNDHGPSCFTSNEKTNDSSVDCKRTRASSRSSPKPPSMLVHKPTVINEPCLRSRTDRHSDTLSQTALVRSTDSAASTTDIQQMDLVTLWRTIETNCLPQPPMVTSSFTFNEIESQNDKIVHMMPMSELAPVPKGMPDAPTARIIDTWLSGCNDLNIDNKNDNNNNYHNGKSKERSKKNYLDSNENRTSKATSRKAAVLCAAFPPASMSMSVVVSASTPAVANPAMFKQQQPAVGVAAIATPLSYTDCCASLGPPVDGNACAMLRQQPWSATTAPEFPSSSLPMSGVFHKRPLPLPLELQSMEATFSDSMPPPRKRATDISWWGDNANEDSSLVKRNRLGNTETGCARDPRASVVDGGRWFEKNMSEFGQPLALTEADCCKVYYPQEQACCSYSNDCRLAGNDATCSGVTWNRPSENINSLHLFRL